MSTYTRPDKFIPVNISSDPTAYLGYVQKRMDLQAQGEAIVQNQYKQYLDLDLTHDTNKEKLNNFLKSASENLSQYTTKDMSNYDNVKKAISVFEPLTKDSQYESVLYDNKFTKHYRNQLSIAEGFKTKVDKKGNIGTGYSDSNYAVLANAYNKFAKSPNSEDPDSWGKLETYQPYYDYKEEHQKLISDFLKQPDEFEIEKLQPETGLTEKVKFQGKSADQINNYISAMISDKAKSQMLIEGRAQSYGIDDTAFEKMYNKTLDDNILNTQDKLDDLKVYKSIDGKKLSAEELKQKKSELEEQLTTFKNTKNGLTNPSTRDKYLKDKESIVANSYVSSTLARMAIATDNKRMSSTYGTNAAYVSMLNRDQHWKEFMLELDFEKTKHAEDLAFKYRKEGLDPTTGQPIGGKTPYESVVPSVEDRSIEDLQNIIIQEEQKIDGFVKETIAKTGKHAFDALGITPSNNPAENIEQRKQAFTYIHTLADNRHSEANQKLLNTPDKDLSARQLSDKRILEELKRNDAKVDIANNYYQKKQDVKNNIKAQVLKDIKDKGLTLDDINDAVTKVDYNMAGRIGSASSKILGNPALGAFGEAATKFGFNQPYLNDNHSPVSSMDEFAERVVSDPEFAKRVSENFGSGKFSFGETDNETGKPLYGYISTPNADFTVYNKSMNKSVIDTFGLLGMKTVYSRPAAVRTAGDKQSESSFNQRTADIIANYKDSYPELMALDPQNIQRVSVENGKITIEAFPTEIDDKGKVTKTGDPIVPIVIQDQSIQNTSEIDKDYNTALALSPNGILNKTVGTSLGKYDYRVRTSSGTPYSPYDRKSNPLTLEIRVGDVFIPIDTETTFNTPSDAIRAAETIINRYEAEVTKELIPGLVKQAGGKEEFKKKYPNPSTLVKEEIKRMESSGNVYRVFGQQNPNKTNIDQQIDDILDNL